MCVFRVKLYLPNKPDAHQGNCVEFLAVANTLQEVLKAAEEEYSNSVITSIKRLYGAGVVKFIEGISCCVCNGPGAKYRGDGGDFVCDKCFSES